MCGGRKTPNQSRLNMINGVPMSDRSFTSLVTGAGSGIGAAIAVELASAGAHVVVVDRDGDAAETVATGIGDAAIAIAADITVASDLDRAVALVAPTGLDVLVNCAGVSDATLTSELGIATFRRVLDINLTGSVELTLRLLPLLRASERGRIVNIASIQ